MDERIRNLARIANLAAYDAEGTRKYADAAPHLKHRFLRQLYAGLVLEVFEYACKYIDSPRVLDLGAGEGSVTLPFLELGARVTAVDLSPSQLEELKKKCLKHAHLLTVRCEDVITALDRQDETYDIVVANSFLHHVPDYLGLIRQAIGILAPTGQFFSFQDPVRYDSIGRPARLFCDMAYFWWRIFKGDVAGGIKRRLRRSRGIYLEDSAEDSAEYHVIRAGVDQQAIRKLLSESGFECKIIPYFSTQSRIFQPIGTLLGVKNTFAVTARRSAS